MIHHLAQVNIARMLAPLTDPLMAGFVAELDAINALADNSHGFLWRLQTPEGNATDLRPYEDDLILVSGFSASMVPTWHSGGFPPVISPVSRRQKNVWPT